jgi:penicillin-binding protein-related factor A (putative recombinase)
MEEEEEKEKIYCMNQQALNEYIENKKRNKKEIPVTEKKKKSKEKIQKMT